MATVLCPDHGVPMRCRDSRYGKFYNCPEWPGCDYKIGCHPGTDEPLGTPANAEMREARIQAHDAFDSLWKGAGAPMRRKEAYRWLAEKLGIEADECHIGMMDVDECDRVVGAVEEYEQEVSF